MKIHEYQAKGLFQLFGLPIVPGILCRDIEEIQEAYIHLNSEEVVLKAQILTGGRGKSGGIKLADSIDEALEKANKMFGMHIKNLYVDRIMMAPSVSIEHEYYLSLTIDRNQQSIVFLGSKRGGVDIEEVANDYPEEIIRIHIDSIIGMTEFVARNCALLLFNDSNLIIQATALLMNMYRLMLAKDASLIEINPLVTDPKGNLIAIDAKIIFDDNAVYRHPDIALLFEPTPEEVIEYEAKAKGFSFVGLRGNIGCMVNGAGLAMATMDIIKQCGGEAANFLDIGGSSNPNKVAEALKLLLKAVDVKVILINIFGGITRCDDVANGLIKAANEIEFNVPIVVRLAGTNQEEAKLILQNSQFIMVSSMIEVIEKAVQLSK